MKLPGRDDLQELLNFTASLLNETTPRAMIIVGAARLEEETKDIVRNVAPGFKADRKSHGSRLELLVSLAYLTEKASNCLRKVTKIRNHFAHSSNSCAFTDSAIESIVKDLFQVLDELVDLSNITEGFFAELLDKMPGFRALAPQTWLDADFRRYQLAINVLFHHLRIIRYNLSSRATPIEIGQWETKNILNTQP